MRNETARLLAYSVKDFGKETALRSVCAGLGAEYVKVPANDYNTPMGILAKTGSMRLSSRPGTLPEQTEITEEMIVMCGFNEEALNSFLSMCRAGKCSVSLKAVLTPVNAFWNGGMLQGVLMQERKEILEQIAARGRQKGENS